MVAYKYTFGLIKETSHISVGIVERVSVVVVTYKSTFGFIQETSHTSVFNGNSFNQSGSLYKHLQMHTRVNHTVDSYIDYPFKC